MGRRGSSSGVSAAGQLTQMMKEFVEQQKGHLE